jgi:predicted esterase
MRDPHHGQPVIVRGRPLNVARGAVVLVHGRGGSAEDILGLAADLNLPDVTYLAPQAADHSWYPQSFLAPIDRNEPWLTSALGLLADVIDRAIRGGVPQAKIALLGFSQGACLSTEFVARNPGSYAGLVALTGGLIGPEGKTFEYSGRLEGTPCFLGSSDPDPHVPWARVRESASVLTSLGGEVKLRGYPGMPHTINEDEMREARQMLSNL